jgi:hypothetical protein
MPTVQTLAATFTIVFEGLVAFIGPGKEVKTYAVIVEDEHSGHDHPHMIINGEYFQLHKGDRVTFTINGKTYGKAKTATSFDTRVPTLNEQLVTAADLKKGVKDKDPKSEGVRAIVTLPDGTLHAQGVFVYPIQFKSADTWTKPCCIAREVRFESSELDSHIHVTITIQKTADTVTRKVSPNADVHIRNTSKANKLHYHVYENLLAGAKTREVNEDESQWCLQFGDDAKMSNALTPRGTKKDRAPRSDCGPTDWP